MSDIQFFLSGMICGITITLVVCKIYFDKFCATLPTKEQIDKLRQLVRTLKPGEPSE